MGELMDLRDFDEANCGMTTGSEHFQNSNSCGGFPVCSGEYFSVVLFGMKHSKYRKLQKMEFSMLDTPLKKSHFQVPLTD